MCVGGVGRGEDRSCAALLNPAAVASSLKAPLSVGESPAGRLRWAAVPSSRASSQPRPPALQADYLPPEPPEKTGDGNFITQVMNETSNWPPFHNFIRKALTKIMYLCFVLF